MPSDPIDHPAETTFSGHHLRRIAAAIAGLALLAAITSCAEGTQRDAREGQEEDTERTSVVRNLQATQTARVLAGTPPQTPTQPAGE